LEAIVKKTRLAAFLAAASVTMANAAFLATPARAAVTDDTCNAVQLAYAQGYGDASCGGPGTATVTRCTSNGDGTFTFGGVCKRSDALV
jgi:hypothetical protein